MPAKTVQRAEQPRTSEQSTFRKKELKGTYVTCPGHTVRPN